MLEKARFLDVIVIISVYLWRFVGFCGGSLGGCSALLLFPVLVWAWFAVGALGCAVALRGSACHFNAILMRGR